MERLILDFVDRDINKYIIKYSTREGLFGSIVIPMNIYNWYTNALPFESTSYDCDGPDGVIKIEVTRALQKSYDKRNPTGYCMDIKVMDFTISVPDIKFKKKSVTTFNFQTFIDVRILDGNGQVIYSNYRFLKNYETRSKAVYYIDKFAYKFENFYKKWSLSNEIIHDIIYSALELYPGDLLFEHKYTFRCKDSNNIAVYTYMIIATERG